MKTLFRKGFIRLQPFVPSLTLTFFCALKVYILLILHPSPSASKGRASFGYLIYQIGKQRHKVIKMINLVLHCRLAAKLGAEVGTDGCQSVFSSSSLLCRVWCYIILCGPCQKHLKQSEVWGLIWIQLWACKSRYTMEYRGMPETTLCRIKPGEL